MAATAERDDPYAGFNFIVEIGGVTVAGFSEVGGLTTKTNAIEYRNSYEDITVRKLPGLKKFANITLKRGYTQGTDLWDLDGDRWPNRQLRAASSLRRARRSARFCPCGRRRSALAGPQGVGSAGGEDALFQEHGRYSMESLTSNPELENSLGYKRNF